MQVLKVDPILYVSATWVFLKDDVCLPLTMRVGWRLQRCNCTQHVNSCCTRNVAERKKDRIHQQQLLRHTGRYQVAVCDFFKLGYREDLVKSALSLFMAAVGAKRNTSEPL